MGNCAQLVLLLSVGVALLWFGAVVSRSSNALSTPSKSVAPMQPARIPGVDSALEGVIATESPPAGLVYRTSAETQQGSELSETTRPTGIVASESVNKLPGKTEADDIWGEESAEKHSKADHKTDKRAPVSRSQSQSPAIAHGQPDEDLWGPTGDAVAQAGSSSADLPAADAAQQAEGLPQEEEPPSWLTGRKLRMWKQRQERRRRAAGEGQAGGEAAVHRLPLSNHASSSANQAGPIAAAGYTDQVPAPKWRPPPPESRGGAGATLTGGTDAAAGGASPRPPVQGDEAASPAGQLQEDPIEDVPPSLKKAHRHTYSWELLNVNPADGLRVISGKKPRHKRGQVLELPPSTSQASAEAGSSSAAEGKSTSPGNDGDGWHPCDHMLRGRRMQRRCVALWKEVGASFDGGGQESAKSEGRPLLLPFLRGYQAVASSGAGGSAFPPLSMPPPASKGSRGGDWRQLEALRREHEQQAELAVVMTTAFRHIVGIPSREHEGWLASGGIPMTTPYRVVPDARHEWEVAAACDEDSSCEGFTPDGRLFRWVGVGTLASMHSKSEKTFAKPMDAAPVYSEVQHHRAELPKRILESGERLQTGQKGVSLPEAVARACEEWGRADGLVQSNWLEPLLESIRSRRNDRNSLVRLEAQQRKAVELGGIQDPGSRPPEHVDPPPSLSDQQWELVEVAGRAAVASPLWMADQAVEAVVMAARQEGAEGGGSRPDWQRVTVPYIRAALGMPVHPLDSNELASGGSDLGRFQGLGGVLAVARATSAGVQERRELEAAGDPQRSPQVYPLRATNMGLVTKRIVSGMPRLVPIEPAAPPLETLQEARERQAAEAKEAAARKREEKAERMEALRAQGVHGVNPEATDTDDDPETKAGASYGEGGGVDPAGGYEAPPGAVIGDTDDESGTQTSSKVSTEVGGRRLQKLHAGGGDQQPAGLWELDASLVEVEISSAEAEDPWALDSEDPLDMPDWAANNDVWYEVWQADIVGNDIEQADMQEATLRRIDSEFQSVRQKGLREMRERAPSSLRDLRADRASEPLDRVRQQLAAPSGSWRGASARMSKGTGASRGEQTPALQPYDGLSVEAMAALRGVSWPRPMPKRVRPEGAGAKGAYLRRQCERTPGCVAVNSNGWMKSSGNAGLLATAKGINVWVRSRGPPMPHDYLLRTLFSLQRELATAAAEGGDGGDSRGLSDICGGASALLLGQSGASRHLPAADTGGPPPASLRGASSERAEHSEGGESMPGSRGIPWQEAIAPFASLVPPSALQPLSGEHMAGSQLLEASVAAPAGTSDYAAELQVPAEMHPGVAARLKDLVQSSGLPDQGGVRAAAEVAVIAATSLSMARAAAGYEVGPRCRDSVRLAVGWGIDAPGSAVANQSADGVLKTARAAVESSGDGRELASAALPSEPGELERLAARGKVHVFVLNTSPPDGELLVASKAELDLYRKDLNRERRGSADQRELGRRRTNAVKQQWQSDYPAFQFLRSLPGIAGDPRLTFIDAGEFPRRIEKMPPPFKWGQPPPTKKKKAPTRGEINQNLQLADALEEVQKRFSPAAGADAGQGLASGDGTRRPPAVLLWEDDCHVCRTTFRGLSQPSMQGVAPGLWESGRAGAAAGAIAPAIMTPLRKVGNGGSGVLLPPAVAFDGPAEYLRAIRGRYNADVAVWRLWADELGSPDLISHRTYSAHRGQRSSLRPNGWRNGFWGRVQCLNELDYYWSDYPEDDADCQALARTYASGLPSAAAARSLLDGEAKGGGGGGLRWRCAVHRREPLGGH